MSAFLTVCAVLTSIFTLGAGMVNEDPKFDHDTQRKALWFGIIAMLATVALAYWGGRWA